jgi:alanine dehydrogenase
VKALAQKGLKGALLDDAALAGGVYTYEGTLVNAGLGDHFGIEFTPLEDLLK